MVHAEPESVIAGPTQRWGAGREANGGTKPRARLLVVDDDRSALTVLSRILEARGFEVSQARSVTGARAQLGHHIFDIVLLDLIMPDEGGQVLLDELAPLCPRTIVIVLTGVHGMDAGMGALRRAP